ncbi:hypothetical protein ACHQM5_006121 [Ranunculus cassubicifolius]
MAHLRTPAELTNTRQMVYEDFPPSSDWTHDANCHVLLIDLPGFKREELKVRVDNFRKVTVSGERQVSENKFSRFKQVYEMPEDADVDNISGRFDGGLLFVVIPKRKQTLVTPHEIEEEKKPSKELEKAHEKKEEIHEEPKKQEKPREEAPRKNEEILHNTEKMAENKRGNVKEGLGGERRRKFEEEWRKQLAERVKTKEELEIIMRNAMDKVRKNKNLIITAVLAFSLGLYISRKLQ